MAAAAALVVLLLLAPGVASAAEPPLAVVSARGLHFEGTADVGGALRAYDWTSRKFEDPLPTGPFHLRAGTLEVSEFRRTSDPNLETPQGGLGVGPAKVSAEYRRFENANAESADVRSLHEFVVLPLPGEPAPSVRFSSPGGTTSLPEKPRYDSLNVTCVTCGSPGVDLAGSVKWNDAKGREQIEVHGAFLLVLYAWDVRVTTPDESVLVQSGELTSSYEGDPTGGRLVDRVDRILVHMRAHDAVLEGPAFALNQAELFLELRSARVQGGVILRDAVGELADGSGMKSVLASELRLDGNLWMEIGGPVQDVFSVRAGGDVDRAQADGAVLDWVQAPRPSSGWPGWWNWALLGIVIPAGGGAEAWRRNRLRGRMKEVETALSEGDYQVVLQRSGPLLRSPKFRENAAVVKAVSLIQLGRLEEADQFLDGLGTWTGPSSATQHYLYAYVRAVRGDLPATLQHLDACLKTAPEFRAEILANPCFAPVLRDAGLARLLSLKPARTGGVEGYA